MSSPVNGAPGAAVLKFSLLLAAVMLMIAVSVYLPKPAWRAGLVLACALYTTLWVAGEALGGILTGSGTDPNAGPLLVLLALAFWPRGAVAEHGERCAAAPRPLPYAIPEACSGPRP